MEGPVLNSHDYEITANDIAVIGMAGRFPGAKNLDEFWLNLHDGVESVSFFSNEELAVSSIPSHVFNHPRYVKARAILQDVELFDASFFGITPREAELMDPQHRVFLECAWTAFENAGYHSEGFRGSIGVYAGVSANTYLLSNLLPVLDTHDLDNCQNTIGNDKDFLTTRVSYKIGLTGPSITVQTACSTSLVAVHLACQSLLNGECDMALAGGVSIRLPQKSGYFYRAGSVESPDGHCRAFDAKAQGTVSGNGVGAIVLRRLKDALTSGDFIHAVIKGSAVNNDGRSRVGYTAPGLDGQVAVVAEALEVAGVEPDSISYIEAHGTGTALGDPIEVAALSKVFPNRPNNRKCAIGSVKTNIGHLDAAAGIAGLIKTILALEHEILPASLHFESPNPQINFVDSPFYVNRTTSRWKASPQARLRAGISSFGIGGTNAHLIVEQAPAADPDSESRPSQLLIFSAKTGAALEAMVQNAIEHFDQNPDLCIADVAYTYQNRCAFNYRRAVVCDNVKDAAAVLRTPNERVIARFCEERDRPVIFVFTDEKEQMGALDGGLYRDEPIFREAFDSCSQLLKPHLNFDLSGFLFSNSNNKQIDDIDKTVISHLTLFGIQYSLAKLWMACGVVPEAMIGNALGEYVAACLSGVFSLDEALQLIVARAPLTRQPAEFRKVGVSLSASDLADKSFIDLIKRFTLKHPKIPYVSSVTGTWIRTDEACDPHYWVRHISPDNNHNRLPELVKENESIFLIVGSANATSAAEFRECDGGTRVVNSLGDSPYSGSEFSALLHTLGRLWLLGLPINWPQFYAGEKRRRLPLPTYPFERQRYWVESGRDTTRRHRLNEQTSPKTQNLGVFKPAPRGIIQERIVQIWKQVLGHEQVSIHDDFFESGGDSLLAVNLIEKLREDFLIELPVHEINQASTIEKLAESIEKQQLLRSADSKHYSTRSLVEIQPGNNEFPIFMVHPAGGTVFCYRTLARCLGRNQMVLGFQIADYVHNDIPDWTIEEIAATYVKELTAFQPGPYILVGASMGGTIAFEMAQQLHRLGERVELLALLDTPGPEELVHTCQDDVSTLAYLASDESPEFVQFLGQLSSAERLAHVRKCIHDPRHPLVGLNDSQARKFLQIFCKHLDAMRRYRPQVYPGRVLFFRAAERRANDPQYPEACWTEVAADGIEVHVVPGNHETMLALPNAQSLAASLRQCISEARLIFSSW